MRVCFFPTCLVDRLLPDAGMAAARLLRTLGADVVVSRAATCCGQPAFNAGYVAEARRIAAHTLQALEHADHIVLPSGSCAAMMRHHWSSLFDRDTREQVRAVAGRTYELAEYIVHVLGITHVGNGLEGRRIAWHHGCHALRELGVRDEPLLLLRNSGASIVDWEASEECCGFGGLFAVKMPEVSAAMADRKLDTLVQAGASTGGNGSTPVDVLASADGGCLLHLEGRMRRRGLGIPVRHLALLLEEAASGTT
jgi:L-lactate dehydrogenase complex protein LldE